MTVILASQSPRRNELLQRILSDFIVIPAEIDEKIQKQDKPVAYVEKMAREKAKQVAKDYPKDVVIGCDTIVTLDEQI